MTEQQPVWPPEHYLVGDGRAVVVPWRVARVLVSKAGLGDFQRSMRGADPEVSSVLAALKAAGQRWQLSLGESPPRNDAKGEASSELGVKEIADLLRITPAAVRLACRQGRLHAEKVSDRWLILREDFEHFRASRQT